MARRHLHTLPKTVVDGNCCAVCHKPLCKARHPDTGQLCMQLFGHDTEENEEDRTQHSNPHLSQLGTW